MAISLKRKAYQRLLDWKERSQGKTAILVEGARRVGKTYLIRDFVSREYKTAVYLDFSRPNPARDALFTESAADLDEFFMRLSLLTKTRLYPRESCIVLDEIQLFPLARQMVKHFVADGRFDFVESGSLISIRRNTQGILIPSEEEKLALTPLDFEEFLWGLNREDLFDYVRSCFEKEKPLGDALHREVMKLFREYMFVGGMPQAVERYVESKDLLAVKEVHKNILTLYRDDIGKYAEGYDLKVRGIFDALPGELSRHEKRFRLASLSKSARMRDYEEAFLWLSDSKVVNLCFNATEPTVGLQMNTDRTYLKCYMADTGLLTSMAVDDGTVTEEAVAHTLLADKAGLNEGMFFENVTAQLLVAAGRKLFFFSQAKEDASRRSLEIDFLIRRERKISPLEVKSGDYKRHTSLDLFSEKYRRQLGTKFVVYTKDWKKEGDVVYLPIYMTGFI